MFDRAYSGKCPHSTWRAFLHGPVAEADTLLAHCPACGPIVLRTIEPPPSREVLDSRP